MKIINSKIYKGEIYQIIVDADDYDRAVAFAVNGWEIKYTTGSNNPYVMTRKTVLVDGVKVRKQYYLHRFIMNVLDDSSIHIDHEFTNTLDNRKSQLRVATRSQNMSNRTSKKTSACKYLGVSYCKSVKGLKKYRTNIKAENIKNNIHLGYYADEDSAGYAYNLAAVLVHKNFANLNEIDESKVSDSLSIMQYVSYTLNKFNFI
jgi:hydrogenase maturation factor